MRSLKIAFNVVMLCLFLSSSASAHYMWIVIEPETASVDKAKMYFEHAAAPGDGHYIDHFATGSKMWLQTPGLPKPKQLTLSEAEQGKQKWLEATLEESSPRSVEMYGKFGVYFYRDIPYLLHYYGRFVDVESVNDFKPLSKAEHQDLELRPEWKDGKMQMSLFWKGKPASDNKVVIAGPQKFRQTLTTDANGQILFSPPASGRYYLRSSIEFEKAGTDDDDQDYKFIRHTGTLMFDLPAEAEE